MTDLPSSPAGAQAQWLLDALALGEPLSQALVEQHVHPTFLARVPADQLSAMVVALHPQLVGAVVDAVEAPSDQQCQVALRAGETRLALSVQVDAEGLLVLAGVTPLAATGTSWDVVRALGPEPAEGWLSEAVDAARTTLQLPGLVAGVLVDGGLQVAAAGVRDVAAEQPFDASTVIRIGSVTKTMTAIAVLQLLERGVLDLDDPVSKHLTSFAVAGPGAGSLTVRHLLSHTGAVVEPTGDIGVPQGVPVPTVTDLLGPELLVTGVPGEAWSYSNAGYATLGQLVADVAGCSYGEYLREHLFVPLGMTSTDVVRSERCVGPLATGYEVAFGEVSLTSYREVVVEPAGSVFSTVTDMARYAAALMGHGGGVLQPDTLALLLTSQTEPAPGMQQCLGFLRHDVGGQPTFWHNGGWPGARTTFWFAPEAGCAVIAHTNVKSPGSDQLDRIGAELLAKGLAGRTAPEARVRRPR